MKRELSQKRWRALATGILLTVSASSVIAMPAFAAEYSQGLTGNVKKDAALIGADGSTVKKNGNVITYEFQGKEHTFNVVNKDAAALNKGSSDYIVNNLDSDGNKGTLHFHQTNTNKNDFDGVTALLRRRRALLLPLLQIIRALPPAGTTAILLKQRIT